MEAELKRNGWCPDGPISDDEGDYVEYETAKAVIEKLEAKIENQDTVISHLEEKLTATLHHIEEARDIIRSGNDGG